MLPFDVKDLVKAVEEGTVTKRDHPFLPLSIYNYAPSVQYSNYWNDVTINCRGLILDDQLKVVARPWKKFFNLGQVNLPIQFDTPVEVMDKVDGSLGILYPAANGYAIATRGSFESDQAMHATNLWHNKYSYISVPEGWTFLFEIIYPKNRIVLNYDGMDDLVLLGAVTNKEGYYLGPVGASQMLNWSGPVVDVMPFNTISDALANTDRPNAEGFVIRSHNFMVKVKQPDYLELHRLVTNASPKSVWEQLKAGKTKSEIVSNFPDEFHSYIESMIDPLLHKFDDRLNEILAGYSNVMDRMPPGSDRKAIASKVKGNKDAGYYFMLLDGKSIRDVLWRELRPRETSVQHHTGE